MAFAMTHLKISDQPTREAEASTLRRSGQQRTRLQARDDGRNHGTDGLIPMATVMALTSLSRSSIERMVERDDFPPPVVLGPRRRAWRLSEVEDWIESRPHAGPVHQPSDTRCPSRRER